ncbi:TetR/AcrR family transcriptional regulator [Flavobacterium antarcticum]|uniref:TetR/AcrR family transcriptional regulator n=1 Tax=Flavobacterium antarcticum TaxID=271155 RepID=UPI00293480B3|nr:TetR/AcrR family transcriptional regulator [Flavobacterium antarcticum]
MMQSKIINKSRELFLKLGFKSITMDDIAQEMSCSKKTLYKFFANKEILVEKTIEHVQDEIHLNISKILTENDNAIAGNFKVTAYFRDMFKSSETSPVHQLKKHYPEIYQKVHERQVSECKIWFVQNIEKGIKQGYFRAEIDSDDYANFYYMLIFQINEDTMYERDAAALEFKALEYHIRAMATPKGITELEHQIAQIHN